MSNRKPFEYPTTVVMYGVAPSLPRVLPEWFVPDVGSADAADIFKPIVRSFDPFMVLRPDLFGGQVALAWYALNALAATLTLPPAPTVKGGRRHLPGPDGKPRCGSQSKVVVRDRAAVDCYHCGIYIRREGK